MRPTGIILTFLTALLFSNTGCYAQTADRKSDTLPKTESPAKAKVFSCNDSSASLLLNSTKEKDDWQIVSGPAINGMHYPAKPYYINPFPSWELDRFTADSSYFRDCSWMILPDKRTVINTVTRLPVVFTRKFTTMAPSKLKLLVKMLYDNMAYLYIDDTWIVLNHRNPDINRFINKLKPELSGFVSIPSLFNYSYNASFYGGDFYNLTLPAGDHVIKIELFNNAYELGCIIKGMLLSEHGEKIFCDAPISEEKTALESILLFHNERAFPKNAVADSLYTYLMHAAKTGYWVNTKMKDDRDIISIDTLLLKKGEKIDITPIYVTKFYNGNTDTTFARGHLKR